ncbi:ABC transporter ATP-binding protein [Candidatus Korarchaeum cryptofilum]|uniref:ABC transporter ATP-binding protein n=1 Tax=Candidatus Korarchaeum cryptofilum TaxID=498846 RepID=A0A429G6T1_9CREN|nr:ABC transporter ATP-binding protein [Candidatus Korarchaeum cryptofilum]RSN69538.1 ABC transporter ATP-binding protein [Candidatus Korarchaeum cryptofilum]
MEEPEKGSRLAIEAENLTKRFGAFTAVDHINLRVRVGENFGLLGPNGAGKTTTIRMITGVIKPTEGSVRVFGIDVVKERDKAIRKIGYMPQRFSLYEDLTVEENLMLYGSLQGLRGQHLRERVNELMDRFYLREIRGRMAGRLSGGMKQRLSLAVALVHDPDLLILDEPTAGVDPPLRRRFWEHFKELNKEGKTILVTTHYMDEAENCDRLALMGGGRVIAEGTPQEIKRKAIGGELVELRVDGDLELKGISGLKEVLKNSDGSYLLLVEDSSSFLPEVLRRAELAGVRVRSASPVFVSLEEAFIRLMG